MKYGIAIRNMGPQSNRATIRACAKAAESMGFDALFVSDHLCIPPDDTEGSGGRYLDVITTLAYLAGMTERIRLGISVLVLPYRPAVLTAKQVATIQELSGERMILGVGVGWMKPEFEALGVNKRMRGRISDETLRVLRHLFANDAEPYDGDLVSFPAFVFAPRPAAPAIWIGGNGDRAIERVLEFGDGWHPMMPADKLKPAVVALKHKLAAKHRGEPEIVVRRVVRFDDLGAAKAKLRAEEEAGATYFILDLGRYPSEREFTAQAETFMTKVV
ncbi:MAG TPA: TIGR03619 family F420-dependent LLM class oxidoreductase [Candidatus Binataceae bacterium]|nr:TIGR03619 family F420-dependent LLM class oxidoreductase [Candidatus Binataceae bacterium]